MQKMPLCFKDSKDGGEDCRDETSRYNMACQEHGQGVWTIYKQLDGKFMIAFFITFWSSHYFRYLRDRNFAALSLSRIMIPSCMT